MTIEQVAQQLSEAISVMTGIIGGSAIECISICPKTNVPRVLIYEKEIFKSINAPHTIERFGDKNDYFQVVKHVNGVKFYTLVQANSVQPELPPIPVAEIEAALGV